MDSLVIIFIFVLAVIFISKGAGLIKTWLKRKDSTYDQEKFDRLTKAFIQYKKQNERRIKKLEAALKKTKNSSSSKQQTASQDKRPNQSIEIESDRSRPQQKTGSSQMKNMLRD